ncbi:MAG TPA: sensor histidine kinase [Steroidobacteraceae bacterium]|nr:sensor histidine kinase [Steroidobacteraceae bacterium]
MDRPATDTGTTAESSAVRGTAEASDPAVRAPSFYLPDFCATSTVLAVVLISELVAIVLTLAREELHHGFWVDLARTSLFLLWIGLSSAAALCYSRPALARMSVQRASAVSLGLLVAVALVISEVTYWLGQLWFGGLETVVGSLFPASHANFVLRNLFIDFIVSALALRYFYVAHEWRRTVEGRARLRIDALQARIRPHFLFNSMNTIASLTRSNPARAEEAVEDLADLFRANLRETRTQIPLKEELEVARLYQRIEELRLGARLKVKWNVQELPMDTLVPSLVVQPLLENAIYHGIEPLPDGGTVIISGARDGDNLELSISNPVHNDPAANSRSGNRIALDNIRERLELAYHGRARMEVENRGAEYLVKLTFPVVKPGVLP